jgi:phosphomethylpyrimidine synthase
MCGPKFCSMKITQDVRDFVAAGEAQRAKTDVADQEEKEKDAA